MIDVLKTTELSKGCIFLNIYFFHPNGIPNYSYALYRKILEQLFQWAIHWLELSTSCWCCSLLWNQFYQFREVTI